MKKTKKTISVRVNDSTIEKINNFEGNLSKLFSDELHKLAGLASERSRKTSQAARTFPKKYNTNKITLSVTPETLEIIQKLKDGPTGFVIKNFVQEIMKKC